MIILKKWSNAFNPSKGAITNQSHTRLILIRLRQPHNQNHNTLFFRWISATCPSELDPTTTSPLPTQVFISEVPLPPYQNNTTILVRSFSVSKVQIKREREEEQMGGFERQVKLRAKEVGFYFKKGFSFVGNSCKKGWHKIKHVNKRSWDL